MRIIPSVLLALALVACSDINNVPAPQVQPALPPAQPISEIVQVAPDFELSVNNIAPSIRTSVTIIPLKDWSRVDDPGALWSPEPQYDEEVWNQEFRSGRIVPTPGGCLDAHDRMYPVKADC